MKYFSFTSLVTVLFFFFIPLFSQSPETGFAINPKSGIYRAQNESGAVLGFETNYLRNGWMFSADFFHFQEIHLFSSDEDMFRQVGIMAGKYYGDRLFRVQLQGGIASIWETGYRDSSEPEKFSTVGFVLKTGFKFIPLSFLSIGVDLQSNLNNKKSLFMPLISIEFGRLRDKINHP
jgi:hypothetical protein